MTRGRPVGSADIPWGSIVERLREYPDRWRLLPEMRRVNVRTINVIRKRERRALRIPDGVVRCRVKTPILVDGVAVCTLYLKLETTKESP